MPVIRLDDARFVFSGADADVSAGVQAWLATLKYSHDSYGNFKGAGYRGSFRPEKVNRQLVQFLARFLSGRRLVAVSAQQATSLGALQDKSRRDAIEDSVRARREVATRASTPPGTGTGPTENIPSLGSGGDNRGSGKPADGGIAIGGNPSTRPTTASRPSPPSGAAAQAQACYENQARIARAVELYNRDHNTKSQRLDPDFLRELVASGYLQTVPDDPGQGPGTSGHYVFTDSGNGVKCTVHGPSPSCSIRASPTDQNAQLQACYSIQRDIAIAVERYNRDNNTKVQELSPDFLAQLVTRGYLKSLPDDPGQGPGTSGHYVFSDSGNGVKCTVHGAPPR
ncbi:MAG: hypothetical protein HY303_21320 [Candidatus Wallbacteria bacterium]|nr:hypothetical protein [Candidatus Wallbacteria bacterium]